MTSLQSKVSNGLNNNNESNYKVDEDSQYLFCLQLSSSSFPTGSFNHSFGFETWFSNGEIDNVESFEQACVSWIKYCLATSETVAVAKACELSKCMDFDSLIELDRKLSALKLTKEAKNASILTGAALLETYDKAFSSGHLSEFSSAIQSGKTQGNYAVIYGIICGQNNISAYQSALTFMQSSVSNLTNVASRIIPLGQIDVQKILKRTWPLIIELATESLEKNSDDMYTASANLDIASMHHEKLKTRLCMS